MLLNIQKSLRQIYSDSLLTFINAGNKRTVHGYQHFFFMMFYRQQFIRSRLNYLSNGSQDSEIGIKYFKPDYLVIVELPTA
jgi:hypothetical protein